MSQQGLRFGSAPVDLGVGMLTVNPRGLVEHVSPRLAETLGYPPAELMGQQADRLLFGRHRQRSVGRRLRRPGSEAGGHFQVELIRKDGTPLSLKVEIATLERPDGEPVGTLAVFHEVTARLQAPRSRVASEPHQQPLLDRLPAILWTVDHELRFTSGAGSGLATLEVEADELIGMSLTDFFGTDDPDFVPIAEHRRALAGHRTRFDFEWAGVLFHVRLEPLRGRGDRIEGAIGLALDVTD